MYSVNFIFLIRLFLERKGTAFVITESIYLQNSLINKSLLKFTIIFSVDSMEFGCFSAVNIPRFYKALISETYILLKHVFFQISRLSVSPGYFFVRTNKY